MQNPDIERTWLRRIPYRALSLIVSGILLASGIAVVSQRVNWRDVAAVWSDLDPIGCNIHSIRSAFSASSSGQAATHLAKSLRSDFCSR
jgi:hypothetical protein